MKRCRLDIDIKILTIGKAVFLRMHNICSDHTKAFCYFCEFGFHNAISQEFIL